MCECGANIKDLQKGLQHLVQHYEDMTAGKVFGDYMYITCSCGIWEEFMNSKYDFIKCAKCRKVYCYTCNRDLVSLVHDVVLCQCPAVTEYVICSIEHGYCSQCALPNCDECILIDDYIEKDDNCPFCNTRCNIHGRMLCQFHAELAQIP